MATKRDIITLPDPLLRKPSDAIEQVDGEVRALIDDMLLTMYEAPGVGLAGVQIAVPKRLIVMDIARDEEEKSPIVMINPQIVKSGDELRSHEEGCLSLPEIFAELERPDCITVKYVDRDGKLQEGDFDGLMSTVIQHEIDHLDGIMFVDHLSKLRRDRLIKKFIKAQRAAADAL